METLACGSLLYGATVTGCWGAKLDIISLRPVYGLLAPESRTTRCTPEPEDIGGAEEVIMNALPYGFLDTCGEGDVPDFTDGEGGVSDFPVLRECADGADGAGCDVTSPINFGCRTGGCACR